MRNNFADRLISQIRKKGNPCVVGLDPRLQLMPEFIAGAGPSDVLAYAEGVRRAIREFHELVLDAVEPIVPAVKPQLAFFEQYGLPGILAFDDTVRLAKERRLVVIVDAKRQDIASTAQAYANAYLGESEIFGVSRRGFDVDALTVSPYLGGDSLQPFVDTCSKFGKGVFALVKTSNAGSADLQDLRLESGEALFEHVAAMINELGSELCGENGYSSVGAVVGATFPEQAVILRAGMPRAIFLVPGYGAQGGKANEVAVCFNRDGLGAVVSASRSITYSYGDRSVSRERMVQAIRSNARRMADDLTTAVANGSCE